MLRETNFHPPWPIAPAKRTRSRAIAVGMDLVEVAQVARSVEAFGERYLRRVFTAAEIAYCMGGSRDPAPHLAARFAAKEATLKALRQGDEVVDWRSVEVRRRSDGSCEIALHGSARALKDRLGVDTFLLSMSHDGGYAAAVVVGERSERRPLSRSRLLRKKPRGAYER
jgi:holo-[acyl-carrier protein] synthase